MTKLTREQAVQSVGEAAVSAVEARNCDFTNRVTNDGTVEFRASIGAVEDGEDVTLCVYYYQDAEAVQAAEELDQLRWVIDHYTVQ